jgi:hypothetical protein
MSEDGYWNAAITALQVARVDMDLLMGPLAEAHEINGRIVANLTAAVGGLGDEIASGALGAIIDNTERIATLQRMTAGAHEAAGELLGRLGMSG